jgi:DNA primase
VINDEDVVAVRSATNIVGVISQYVQLRRVGRRWQGLCPFHDERTPSFSVNEAEGLYYCFGCGKRGDSITFVREVEGVDFVGAVERLAAKAGVVLRYTDPGEGEQRKRRARLVAAVAKAVDWYHERLLSAPDAGPARGYLRSRGITAEEVRRFKLGWAPDDWDQLARALRVGDDVWRDSGLGLINRMGRQQDFFRGRVLFPILDPQGEPIGFGGRILPGGSGGKYINPTGTPIYDKSKVLYGLSWAKADIVNVREAIVCEGYTDVMGFFAAGVPRAVATCGTALTEDHVKVLSRFSNRLVLAFDADGAGQAAAERFHQWEERYALDVRVASLPAGVDPADLARSDAEALRKAVADAMPFLAFRLQRVWASADLSGPEGRARAAQQAVEVVRQHPNALVRDQYLMEVAARCRVDVAQLRQSAERTPAAGAKRVAVDHVVRRQVKGSSPAEADALRVAVEDVDTAAAWLDPVLFAEGPNRRALTALLTTGSLTAALSSIGDGDPEVVEVLHQVAMDQSDATVEEVFLRLCREAAKRALEEVRDRVISAEDPLSQHTVYQDLVRRWSSLTNIDDASDVDAKLEAGTDLLAWLIEPGEGAR